MSGFICIYALDVTTGNGSWDGATCPYTLPEEYCPSISTTAPVITGNGGSWTGYISVSTAGKIVVGNYGNSGSGDKRRGFLMYPISMQHSVSHDIRYAHLSWKAPYSNSTIQFDRIGNVVICHGNVKFTASAQCNYSTADETLPKGFRPTEANVPIVFSMSGNFAIFFESSGRVTMLGNPNSDYACCTGSWYTKDDFPE